MLPMPDDLPTQYLEGIRLFNSEEFFDCHDALEELWSECRGEERKFIQGLIQASIALFHFGNENYGGAKKLYNSSTALLSQYGAVYMSLDLQAFLEDFAVCFAELLANTEAYPTTVSLQDELIPRMRLVERE